MLGTIAEVIGYVIMLIMAIGIIGGLYQWLVYGKIGYSVSQKISGDDIYVNGKKVAKSSGGNISMINGSVYEDGRCIYKHKRKYRWEK